MTAIAQALRVAALVKQVPRFEELQLGPDGRLVRAGLDVELNPYCRRAVATAVTLAGESSGTATVFTLGPPAAEDVLREAIAWGADDGVLISDPAFAGSDTLATARALAAALERDGSFDLVLVGRNSVDADTGQVGPQLAELLGVPFIGGARTLSISAHGDRRVVAATLEHDDGWMAVEVDLPVVVSCAERLCEPCKVDPARRAAVPADRIRLVRAADLGPGPWGEAGSPTRVGEVRLHIHQRERVVLEGSLDDQVDRAIELLEARGALDDTSDADRVPHDSVPGGQHVDRAAASTGAVAVIVEPGRAQCARELLGAAARLGTSTGRATVAIVPSALEDLEERDLGRWGADSCILIEQTAAPDDLVVTVADWCERVQPWALLVPSTMWGREVAGRLAARLGAGLTGDATGLELVDGRLVAWKPAFGGQLEAAITSRSELQMVTVRPGVLPILVPRTRGQAAVETLPAQRRSRVRVLDSGRDDDVEILATAPVVVGVGVGVDPARYGELDDLLAALGATLGASRKVTDRNWMPRARQIGITGRSIQPRLYVALAVSGKFNHVIGVRAAETVLAINTDPEAPIFGAADVGIVGDWAEAVTLLAERVAGRRASVA